MLKRLFQMMTVLFCTTMLMAASESKNVNIEEEKIVKMVVAEAKEYTAETSRIIEIKTLEKLEEELPLSNEEIELIALVTMAEAEGECEEGKRLVIDTILNRVDSEHFPDTVTEVIYQPHQFSAMWCDRIDKCYVTEEICQLVREELISRTNYDVVFFNANHYSKYGTPLFQVENHYFSSYD